MNVIARIIGIAICAGLAPFQWMDWLRDESTAYKIMSVSVNVAFILMLWPRRRHWTALAEDAED
ncbi:MAG: hypothetical protein RLZZ324_5 [Candidatus Parcubacteria bacterium]|jgi:hypothetical protein